MKCLIIAAGRGSRLEPIGYSKPLVQVLGRPLIERVFRTAAKAGIRDFYLVTGYKGPEVRRFVDAMSPRWEVSVTHLVNEEWTKGNGLSVLKAGPMLKERFLLLMGDHLLDPGLLKGLLEHEVPEGEITLAVDRNPTRRWINMADVTKVRMKDGKVLAIGKDLPAYDGFDVGVFLCSPAIFEGISESISSQGDTTLTGGVRCLAKEGRVNGYDIGERYWVDVDDARTLKSAEEVLLGALREKQEDGPVSKYLNRPISHRITRRLAKLPITPNQISLASFALCVFSSLLFMSDGYPALLAGGILTHLASLLDGCDGEVARIKYQETAYGGWFDAVLDRYADGLLLFGLSWHCLSAVPTVLVLSVGFMAIIGSFMVSYTADKYDARMRGKIGFRIRLGRDSRLLLISLGGVLNQAFLVLMVVAVLMNGEAIRRVWICRDHG